MWWQSILHRFDRLSDDPLDEDSRVCFLATKYGPQVLCDELPEWLHASGVATWYPLGRFRHAMEWSFGSVCALVMLYTILSRTRTVRPGWHFHPMPVPLFVAAIYHFHHYDWFIPLPERGWLLTPCHTGWTLRVLLQLVPMPDNVAEAIRQTLMCFSSLAALFIFQPDGEVVDAFNGNFSWSLYHHALLLLMPVMDVALGYAPVLPPPRETIDPNQNTLSSSPLKFFVKWHMISMAMYILIYGGICTPISLLSGANWGLSVHFHRTQVSEYLHLTGPNYRLFWVGYCNILFALTRLGMLVTDLALRESGLSYYSQSRVMRRAWMREKEQQEEQQRLLLQQKQAEKDEAAVTNGGATKNGGLYHVKVE